MCGLLCIESANGEEGPMATILEFRASNSDQTAQRRRPERTAEIVIFPGIRYERWSARDERNAAKPAPVTRDVLSLLD